MRAHSWSRSVVFGLVVAILIGLAVPAGAEEGASETFGEVIDVTVINLEAVVTDKAGNPVTGLRPEDFVLVVDGQEMPIEYFSEIRQRRAVEPGEPGVPPETAADPASTAAQSTPAPAPITPAGAPVGTSYLVFVDNYFSIPRDRNLVLERFREELSALAAGDQMAIVAFDGRQLALLSDWSPSAEQIAEKIEHAGTERGLGAQRLGEQNLYELQRRSQNVGLIGDSDAATIEDRIRQLGEQTEKVLRAATTTLRAVSRPPGRKVMLLLSGGWPADPATYIAGINPEIRNRTLRFSPKKAFEELVDTANLLGYTLYPVDVPGRQVSGTAAMRTAADRGDHITDLAIGMPKVRSGGGAQRDPPPDLTTVTFGARALAAAENDLNASGREQQVETSLITLAEQTGGLAFLNGHRQGALGRAIEDTSTYYWLGFSPQRKHDDQVHSVRVEVKNPRLEVRTRSGFKDLSRSAEVGLLTEGQLLFSTDLVDATLGVELGELAPEGRKARLPVSLRIPLDAVVMLPTQGGYGAQLELRVAALDARGRRSEIPVIPVRFGGPQLPAPGAHAVYETTLELRSREKQRLVLSLHDLVGGKILSATVELDPG